MWLMVPWKTLLNRRVKARNACAVQSGKRPRPQRLKGKKPFGYHDGVLTAAASSASAHRSVPPDELPWIWPVAAGALTGAGGFLAANAKTNLIPRCFKQAKKQITPFSDGQHSGQNRPHRFSTPDLVRGSSSLPSNWIFRDATRCSPFHCSRVHSGCDWILAFSPVGWPGPLIH